MNLFNNAFKAMEKGGELSLEARNDGSWIEVILSETGGGGQIEIDRGGDALHSSSRQASIENGTAIDLSICYSIVQHHKGDLRVENNSGHGAVYTLRVPVILT